MIRSIGWRAVVAFLTIYMAKVSIYILGDLVKRQTSLPVQWMVLFAMAALAVMAIITLGALIGSGQKVVREKLFDITFNRRMRQRNPDLVYPPFAGTERPLF